MQMDSVKKVIEETLEKDKGKKIIIFPYGYVGQAIKRVLNDCYGVKEAVLIDNHFARYNPGIEYLSFLNSIDVSNYTLIFAYAEKNESLYDELKSIFPEEQIHRYQEIPIIKETVQYTKCGKYTYGPLCNHYLVEEIGAFSSIAAGVDVVQNHAMDYISTHMFIYHDNRLNDCLPGHYEDFYGEKWNLSGVQPKGVVRKLKRSRIGNDVWLGKNVLITNGANVGNGVIAGAGAVITKDVPDYAVVVGVPAKIIRYRYTSEQIRQLNTIAWWKWSDDKIRKYYDDFFENIDTFIQKHINDSSE